MSCLVGSIAGAGLQLVVGQFRSEAVSTALCGRKMRSKQCPMQSSTLWNVSWPLRWLNHSNREGYRQRLSAKTTSAPSHVVESGSMLANLLEILVRARKTVKSLYVSLLEVRMRRQRLDDRFR